jgi:hypothetical protein
MHVGPPGSIGRANVKEAQALRRFRRTYCMIPPLR